MRTLYQSIRLVLDDLDSTCTTKHHGTSKNDMELNYFPIVASYCSDISEGKDVSGFPRGLSVRRIGIRCLSAMKDIRQ